MNIYGLKGLIKAMEVANNPADQYLLEFYRSLYQEQLDQIAKKVQQQLDQELNQEQKNELYFKSKSWNDYLSK
jgi:hypothetical protein